MRALMGDAPLRIDQDLGLGMALAEAARYRGEAWADALIAASLTALDRLWVDAPGGRGGYVRRSSRERNFILSFGNAGVAIGLQAAGVWPSRVTALLEFFDAFRSGDEYDTEAITWVMWCCAHLPGVLLPTRTS